MWTHKIQLKDKMLKLQNRLFAIMDQIWDSKKDEQYELHLYYVLQLEFGWKHSCYGTNVLVFERGT